MSERGARVQCAECAREIEVCEFCEEADCAAPACYRCLLAAMRENAPKPYSPSARGAS